MKNIGKVRKVAVVTPSAEIRGTVSPAAGACSCGRNALPAGGTNRGGAVFGIGLAHISSCFLWAGQRLNRGVQADSPYSAVDSTLLDSETPCGSAHKPFPNPGYVHSAHRHGFLRDGNGRCRTEDLSLLAYPHSWLALALCKPSTSRSAIEINHSQEITMNKDQVKGRVEEVKGKAKEIAGKISGNEELEQKGKIQNIGGKIQAGFGDVKEDVKKAVKDD
jgi:uncharacterized protein YjbJ (UPF0337 family)